LGGYTITVCNQPTNSALHPSGVAKSSTSFGWGKGWNVTSAGWQVTLCDHIWHVSSSSGEACCELLYPVTLLYYYFTLLYILILAPDLAVWLQQINKLYLLTVRIFDAARQEAATTSSEMLRITDRRTRAGSRPDVHWPATRAR